MHAKHTATSQTHTRAHTIPFGMNLFRQTAISDVGMSLITPLNPTEESAGHCVRLQGTHIHTHRQTHVRTADIHARAKPQARDHEVECFTQLISVHLTSKYST